MRRSNDVAKFRCVHIAGESFWMCITWPKTLKSQLIFKWNKLFYFCNLLYHPSRTSLLRKNSEQVGRALIKKRTKPFLKWKPIEPHILPHCMHHTFPKHSKWNRLDFLRLRKNVVSMGHHPCTKCHDVRWLSLGMSHSRCRFRVRSSWLQYYSLLCRSCVWPNFHRSVLPMCSFQPLLTCHAYQVKIPVKVRNSVGNRPGHGLKWKQGQ